MGDESSNLEVSCHFKNNCSQRLDLVTFTVCMTLSLESLNLTIHLLQVHYLEINKRKINLKFLYFQA